MSYAKAWTQAWCTLFAAGDGIAMLEWSPLTTVAGTALVSCCAAVGYLSLRAARDRQDPPLDWNHLVSRSLAAGGGPVAFSAVSAASPPIAMLVAIVALLTSPMVLRRVRPGRPLVRIRALRPTARTPLRVNRTAGGAARGRPALPPVAMGVLGGCSNRAPRRRSSTWSRSGRRASTSWSVGTRRLCTHGSPRERERLVDPRSSGRTTPGTVLVTDPHPATQTRHDALDDGSAG